MSSGSKGLAGSRGIGRELSLTDEMAFNSVKTMCVAGKVNPTDSDCKKNDCRKAFDKVYRVTVRSGV